MIHEYKYIYEVYKEKSFSKAAKKLYISQPSLSATVKKIESSLGYKIFDRSTANLTLTEEGQVYIKAAEKILSIEHDLNAAINDISNLEAGNLTIAGSALFSSCVIPHIVRVFSELYPKINLNFVEADSLLLYEEAQKDEIDLIIDGGNYEEETFHAEPLFQENILLAVPKDSQCIHKSNLLPMALSVRDIISGKHLLPSTPAADLALFSEEPFILLKSGHDLHDRALDLCQEAGFSPRNSIHLNQLMTAFHVASTGLGITLITDTLVRHGHVNAPLYYFKIRTAQPDLTRRDVFIAYRKKRQVTNAMRSFIHASQKIRTFD